MPLRRLNSEATLGGKEQNKRTINHQDILPYLSEPKYKPRVRQHLENTCPEIRLIVFLDMSSKFFYLNLKRRFQLIIVCHV